MRTNAASLRDAGEGEGGERYFLPNFASLRDAGSPFTIHHKSLIFDKSGRTKSYRTLSLHSQNKELNL
jgi:hypothetical protein